MKRRITVQLIEEYKKHLYMEEKSKATIEKYTSDLTKLMNYANARNIDKELMIKYKEYLISDGNYKVSSANSYIVAANRFFEYMKWYDAKIKTYKVQQEAFCPENKCLSKGEYKRLIKAALNNKKTRLAMIIQTIGATGIRISELSAVTVESVKKGVLIINNKGKIRKVLLPADLQKSLLLYIHDIKIRSGVVFCTKNGNVVNRSNVWKEMKALCKDANVNKDKVFPHNLRHLFAQTFYGIKKDIAKLADVLGHSSIETTRIYVRGSSKEYRRQLEQMEMVVV